MLRKYEGNYLLLGIINLLQAIFVKDVWNELLVWGFDRNETFGVWNAAESYNCKALSTIANWGYGDHLKRTSKELVCSET